MVRRILLTGGNKGVGFAIARRCVQDHDDVEVILGCRSLARGEAAAATLNEEVAGGRVSVVELDTSSEASVARAAKEVERRHGAAPSLYGIVNNAGIVGAPLADILETNTRGPKRVDDAFLPLLDPARGRIVQISSGSAPSCVAKSSEARRPFFVDPEVTWAGIDALMGEALGAPDLASLGIGEVWEGYGFSKALLTCYTVALARDHPNLKVNACTPGLISTDLVHSRAPWYVPSFLVEVLVKNVAGAKDPDEGTRSTMYLLFDDDLQGNGRFYGSDARRSPLDVPRDPGTPPYEGP